MKHIKIFELYNLTKSNVDLNNWSKYYFETDGYQYEVGFIKYGDTNYYSVGFKAKTDNEYFYDMSKITNENPYKLMQTVVNIMIKFYHEILNELQKIKVKYNMDINITDYMAGFIFSFNGASNKSMQRLNLYKRYIPNDWNLTINDNIFYLTKK